MQRTLEVARMAASCVPSSGPKREGNADDVRVPRRCAEPATSGQRRKTRAREPCSGRGRSGSRRAAQPAPRGKDVSPATTPPNSCATTYLTAGGLQRLAKCQLLPSMLAVFDKITRFHTAASKFVKVRRIRPNMCLSLSQVTSNVSSELIRILLI